MLHGILAALTQVAFFAVAAGVFGSIAGAQGAEGGAVIGGFVGLVTYLIARSVSREQALRDLR